MLSQQIQRQYLTTTLQTFNATDNYTYTDGMNRLNTAAESSVWADSYIYDCMSNRAVTASSTSASMLASNFTPQTSSTSSCVVGGASPTVPFDANNRWTAASYDAAGDMTSISTQTMLYDAERRLTKLPDTGTPATTVVYGYDADGQRVIKTTPAGTTIYVYGPDGELAGEVSTIPSASIAGTEYVTADHLGSTRLTTDSQGGPLGCHDYLPFGQEIPSSWGRSTVPCYSPVASDTDQKFTGQVRDSDTSPALDQLGYRYLSGPQGRFTSPDAAGVMLADLGNPQSWNMYSYTWNNPMSMVDPSGLVPNGLTGVASFGGGAGGGGTGAECNPWLYSPCGGGDDDWLGLGWSPTNNVVIPPYGNQGGFPNGFPSGNLGGSGFQSGSGTGRSCVELTLALKIGDRSPSRCGECTPERR